ncbi:MAG: pyridoxamine 5'-phosphate oxidase family protein [Flavisolibacter sp.]
MEKNLQNKEAKEKFKKLVNDIKVCMFITNNPESDHTRPMFTIEVEEDDSLWFFTDSRSLKVEEVKGDKNVHLVYAHPGKESYLDVWGSATINTDKKNIKDKWTPMMKAWFHHGVDDPNLCLLKVKPQNVYYWDAQHGKMISILKMVVAAVTGKNIVEDVQGKLSV